MGEEEQAFHIHGQLLCANSEYLKEKIDLQSGKPERTITLDEDVDAFGVYADWLYTGQIGSDVTADEPVINKDDSTNNDTDATSEATIVELAPKEVITSSNEWPLLAGCLVLAHNIGDNAFFNASINCVVEAVVNKNRYPTSITTYLYDSLPRSSPALQLFADFWVHQGEAAWIDEDAEDSDDNGPKQFWVRVAKGLLEEFGSEEKPWLEDRCKYHKHAKGEPKCT